MKGQMDTQYGKILIDEDVIATYAGSVAVECFGIVGMAAVNMKDGLVKLLKKDYLTHGISVVVEEDVDVMKQAKEARENGQQVLVVRMNKNKKFQKEQLAKEGYEEFVEFFNK